MKKHSSIFIFTALLFSSILLSAQEDKPTVEGEITKQQTSPNFIAFNLPWIGLRAAQGGYLAADVGAKFKMNDFYMDINYLIGYLYGFERMDDKYILANSITDYKSPKVFSVNAGYILSKKEADKKIEFLVRSSGHVAYVTEVNCKSTKFIMLKMGVKNGDYTMLGGGKDFVYEPLHIDSVMPDPIAAQTRTIFHYNMFRAGVTFGTMGYWETVFDKYGKRKASRYTELYADMLFLTGSKINDVSYDIHDQNLTTLGTNSYTIEKSKRSKLGLCFGISTTCIQGFAYDAGAEIGIYPGIKGSLVSNLGVMLRTNITIGALFN